MSPYYVFFSGAVGVGKSTLMNSMKLMLNQKKILIIKEYIDYHKTIGDILLGKLKEGKISDWDFQNYILDCYEAQFSKITNEEIILVERHPSEALEVFIKRSQNRMQPYYENKIEERINNLMKKYSIPELGSCMSERYNTSIFTVKAIIEDFNTKIINYYRNDPEHATVCFLEADLEDMIKRVKMRGRPSEEKLQGGDLFFIKQAYENFFKQLKLI